MQYLDDKVKLIKKLQYNISFRDEDVVLMYKGTGFGNSTPWNIRCGNFEANAEDMATCVENVISKITNELQKKLQASESQAKALKTLLDNLQN